MTHNFLKMFNAFGPEMIKKAEDETTSITVIAELFEESLKETKQNDEEY